MSHSPSPSSVLILGARGRFGSAAVHAFAQAGWQVHAQMRPGATPPPAAPGVQWLLADPDDTAVLAAAAKSAAVVVQGLSPLYTHKVWRTEVPRLTNAAIAITRELRATLMLPASVYNFGEGMPARLLEDTPQNATTFMGRMRIASEALVREATLDGGMKAVVIRGGNFFGSGSGSWLDLVAKDIQKGRLSYPGAANVPVSWAYLPDMARSFVDVANRREALPAFEALHFAGHTLTQQDWVDALDEIAWERGWLPESGRLQVKAMSWPLLRALGLFMPTLAAICEMRYLWRVPHGLVNRRMAALAGPEAHTPFEKALRTSLDELGLLQGRTAHPAPDLARA